MTIRTLTRRHLGENFNEGARRMWLELVSRGWTIRRAQEELGFTEGLLNRLVYGDRRPGLETALRVKEVFGIDVPLWHEPSADPRFEVPRTLGSDDSEESAPPSSRTDEPNEGAA